MKKALLTGSIGQDVFHLAELLLEKGYEVHGIKSHITLLNNERVNVSYQGTCLAHPRFHLHYGELTDSALLVRLVQELQPDELYNLGAMPHVNVPFETPELSMEVNALGTLRLLEAVRGAELTHKTRIYQTAAPASQLVPSSSVATKLNSYQILTRYRTAYGMHACNGTLFGQDFSRRGETLLIRKITQGAVRLALGLQGTLYLDTLNHCPDWGHTRDYAECMWRILQQDEPEDFVIATGITTTVREFVRLVFAELNIDLIFQGEGLREVGYVAACHNSNFTLMPGQTVVAIDPVNYRAKSVEPPLAEASKARRQLGWKPRHDLRTLVQEMVQHNLHLFRRDTNLIRTGHHVFLQPH
jgi:GDPmannose 4,6-dehydratase